MNCLNKLMKLTFRLIAGGNQLACEIISDNSRVVCAFASCTYDFIKKEEVLSIAFMAECEFVDLICSHEVSYLVCKNDCYEKMLNIERQMIHDEDWPEMIGVVDDDVLQEISRSSEMRHSVNYNYLPDQTE